MSRFGTHILVMAKSPHPGRVKTRLCPPCTLEDAARIAEAALVDTLAAVAVSRADRKVVALDGPPGPWLPPGFEVLPQRGLTLADRLANAWSDLRPAVDGWGVQIGMDTPQVTTALLDRCLADGAPNRALLGAAVDGGWWIIGLPPTDPYAVFGGIETSRPDTGSAQTQRLLALGFTVHRAPLLRDIDTIADLVAVAEAIPRSRTAAATRAIGTPERDQEVA